VNKPRICVAIVEKNLEAIKEIEPDIDFFELRIDLIGPDWPEIVRFLNKPWIACNRSQEEGGQGSPDQVKRIEELLWAAEAGASIVDIELRTPGLADIIPLIKPRAKCLVSYHDIIETPAYETLVSIAESQIKAGADICKIITTANIFEDNLTVLKLISRFPETKMVAFAMGEAGRLSRVLSPLAGGYFTYACMTSGRESAAGQIPVRELYDLYRTLKI
jgi:3-dehydroquinate dehydratase type I